MYLYPLWIRLWHLVNAIMIFILILTGISMYFDGETFFMFKFERAVKWHNVAAVILTISYIIFHVPEPAQSHDNS